MLSVLQEAEKKNFTNEMIMDAVEHQNETVGAQRPLSPGETPNL